VNEGGGKWIKPSGFNDKGVLCPFCARCMPAVSTNLNIHIATDCALDHPARAEAALAVVGSKTALKRLGKDKQDLLNKIKEEYTSTAASLSTFNQSLGGSAPANPPSGASPGLNLGANAGAGSGKRPYNDLITTPYNDWFIGTVTKVDKRKLLPVHAVFEDREADLCLDSALYGVSGGREWALLQQGREQRRHAIIDVEDDTSDDGDADADADDPIDRLDIHDLLYSILSESS